MNYLVLIIIALAGIALGMYLARRKGNGASGLIAEQAEADAEGESPLAMDQPLKRLKQPETTRNLHLNGSKTSL